jgi:DNA-directed RNA polymerase II subunit RPB2
MNDWDILDLHFKDHKYPFTNHHLDSYRELIKTFIPQTIKSYNPITMIKLDDNKKVEIMKADVYIGGKNSDLIYVDHPISFEGGQQKITTPNDARMKSITYETHIYADVHVEITNKDGEVFTRMIPKVAIGSIPIMLHSDICVLNGNGNKVLQRLGECIYDGGGYFIIDGKEKVIIAQETETNNSLIVGKIKDDDNFSYKGKIKCSGEIGETVLVPRTIEFYLVKDYEEVTEKFNDNKGAIYVSLPSIDGKIPLFILFRALGVESDKDIYETIFGIDNNEIETNYFQNFIRPSVYNNYYIRDSDKQKVHIYTQEQALDYIKFRTKYKTLEYVKYLFASDIFPNINLFENKGKYLGYLTKEFINVALGIRKESDRDNYFNKRIYISGFLLAELFQESYMKLRKTIRDTMDNFYYFGTWKNTDDFSNFINKDNVYRLIPVLIIADTFAKALKGRWGLENDDNEESGKVQDLSRISYIGFLSHLRRVNMPIDRSIKVTAPHKLHSHQWGIMCPFETPDGAAVGYLKNLAFLTKVTAGTNPEYIRRCLSDIGVIPIENYNLKLNKNITKVFVNNSWYGITNDPILIMRTLRAYRRNALINILTTILWNNSSNEIRVYVDVGRAVRPLIILKDGKSPIFTKKFDNWFDLIIGKYNNYKNRNEEIYYKNEYTNPRSLEVFKKKSDEEILEELEKEGAVIEYIDPEETDNCYIAMTKADINSFHTHVEIHPSTALSVVSANIPICNHNAAARNLFHAAMTKQAIGIYATNFNKRFDTFGFIQHYPQKAIINTRHSQYTGSDVMANGANLIVAIMTYTGFNQEDSLIINKRSIERGMFHLSYYKTIAASTKKVSPFERIIFKHPKKYLEELQKKDGSINIQFKHANYDLLDDDGIIKEGSYIPRGQKAVIIGMILEVEVMEEVNNGLFKEVKKRTIYKDQSIVSDESYYGYADKVYVGTKTMEDDVKVCKVRLMKIKIPEFGDKHSSRHGQKGVIGMILPEEQMPFTKDGVRPDLIVNPHAIPTRMTIAHLVECVYAKLCCIEGFLGDGTVFINLDYENIYNHLEKNNYERFGNEILYNGQTGRQMNTEIFIGPTYYFRLKHMVAEKINARGVGPNVQLTRQPTGGRRKAGGLRIGEMERDSLISHGISRFIKESMMERSDKYRWRVCNNCGTLPVYGNKVSDSFCKLCGNTEVNMVETPYTFKLFSQEFEAMGVQMRVNCDYVDIPQIEGEDEIQFHEPPEIIISKKDDEKKEPSVVVIPKKVVAKKKDDLLKEVEAKFPKLTSYKSLNKEQLEYLLELTTIEEAREFVKTKDMKKVVAAPKKGKLTKEDLIKEIVVKYPTLKGYNTLKKDDLEELLKLSTEAEVKEFIKTIKIKKGGEGTDDEGTDDEGTDDEGTDDEGTDDEGTDDEGTDEEGTDEEGTDEEGTDEEDTNEEETEVSDGEDSNNSSYKEDTKKQTKDDNQLKPIVVEKKEEVKTIEPRQEEGGDKEQIKIIHI